MINVCVCVELFLAARGDFRGVFERSPAAIEAGVSNYVERMREFPAAPQNVPSTDDRACSARPDGVQPERMKLLGSMPRDTRPTSA